MLAEALPERIQQQFEVVRGLDSYVASTRSKYIKPVESMWNPSDLLPDMSKPDWLEQVMELRKQAAGLSNKLLVAVTGAAVTEEGLPMFLTWLNRIPGMQDDTGRSQGGWATFGRDWTSDEWGHDKFFDRWLNYSGRINMPMFDITVRHYLRNGFDPRIGKAPYKALFYVSFQEDATRKDHSQTGHLAIAQGDSILGKGCLETTKDEARHAAAYADYMGKVIEKDPELALIEIAEMMEAKIAMPAALMDDRSGLPHDALSSKIFEDYSAIVQELQIYTASDYVEIARKLFRRWGVFKLQVGGEAAKAQAALGKYTEEYGKRVDRAMSRTMYNRNSSPTFSWIFDQAVPLTDPRKLRAQVG